MALAFDAVGPSAAGQTATTPTSVTWSHTTSGSNRALVVYVGVGENSGADGTKTISGVTYAGVAMTQIGTPKHTNNSTFGYLACYGLIAPASGANNVVVSFNAAPSVAECGSLSFTGADQTTAFATPVTGVGDSATATAAATSNTSGNIIAFGVCAGSDTGTNPTSPATKRVQANFSHSSAGGCFGIATIPATGSSVTCAWPITSDFWALIAVEVKTASGGGSLTADAALSGTGSLAVTATAAKAADSALSGTASATSAAIGSKSADAALAGTATLATTATPSRNADSSLSGGGSLSATAISQKFASATATATGTLTGAASGSKFAGTALTGTGALAATANSSKSTAATLAGTGTLSASATVTSASGVDANLAGAGMLASTATSTKPVGAALSGVGSLSGSATPGRNASAALTATGGLSGAATSTKPAAANLMATGTLTASATVTASGSSVDAALNGTGTLNTTALLTRTATTALTGTAALTAQMTVSRSVSGVLVGAGSFAAAVDTAGQVVIRPNLGRTSRPGSGRTIRPYAGTTIGP